MIFVDVDVQRDFCEPDGALSVSRAPSDVFRALTQLAMERHIPVLGSVDSHAFDAWEFGSNDNVGPNGEDPRFPDHCVKGTEGWLKVAGTLVNRHRFVPCVAASSETAQQRQADALAEELSSAHTQALYFEKEVYSLFANPLAEAVIGALVKRATDHRFAVYGVATDYCVKAAALGLRERGYEVMLLTDAVAGITPEGVTNALSEMMAAGVRMVASSTLM